MGAIEQRSNAGLFQNNPQMAFSTNVGLDQVTCAVNYNEQSRSFDTVVHGDTGIRIRTRQGRNDQPDMNPTLPSQGIAPRRIRLGRLVTHSHGSDETAKDGSGAPPQDHNSKTIIAGVRILFI